MPFIDLNAARVQSDGLDSQQASRVNGMSNEDLMNLGEDGVAERKPRLGLLARLRAAVSRKQRP